MLDALPPIRGYMFDLDGTLLLSDRSLGGYEVLPDAVECASTLKDRSTPFVVLTNGSAYPPPEQAAKLRKLGLPVEDEQMLTPSSVTAEVMLKHGGKRPLILGLRGVAYALQAAGLETVFPGDPNANEADAVYVGWHPDCNMKDIEAACTAIWRGAKMYVALGRAVLRHEARPNDGLLLRNRRRDQARDQGAVNHHRQTVAARAPFRLKEAGSAGQRRGCGWRRSQRRDHHGAQRRRDRVRRDDRCDDRGRLGTRVRRAPSSSGAQPTWGIVGLSGLPSCFSH